MKTKLLALLMGIAVVSISQPSHAEIKNVANLPRIEAKAYDVFELPWNRPALMVDDFLGHGRLVAADISADTNFLGIYKKRLISIWSTTWVSFVYCAKDNTNQSCVNLNGREAYVKVDGKVFMLEIDRVGQKSPYKITPELREAISKTTKPLIVRVGTISDREIGIGTVSSLHKISAYIEANSCAEKNALCTMQSANNK